MEEQIKGKGCASKHLFERTVAAVAGVERDEGLWLAAVRAPPISQRI